MAWHAVLTLSGGAGKPEKFFQEAYSKRQFGGAALAEDRILKHLNAKLRSKLVIRNNPLIINMLGTCIIWRLQGSLFGVRFSDTMRSLILLNPACKPMRARHRKRLSVVFLGVLRPNRGNFGVKNTRRILSVLPVRRTSLGGGIRVFRYFCKAASCSARSGFAHSIHGQTTQGLQGRYISFYASRSPDYECARPSADYNVHTFLFICIYIYRLKAGERVRL